MKHYQTLVQLYHDNNWPEPEHPLFSMISCQPEQPREDKAFTVDAYVIALKKLKSGVIMYGRTPYDNHAGCMYFMKPRQLIELKRLDFDEAGFMLFIHEDYLSGNVLHNVIQHYNYFDYEVNEALHLSPKEELIIWELRDKIIAEYNNNQDEYSKMIILGYVASILIYAQRFYKRQFINRTDLSGKTVSRFDQILKNYMANNTLRNQGLPTVNYMAGQLFLSPRYLSDLLKQETGKTAMDLIHLSLIAAAKNLLRSGEKDISEIAYELGFESISYFTRLFKKQSGMTPSEFRKHMESN